GFGGTNAHVVIRQPEAAELLPRWPRGASSRPAELLVLSAHSRPALNATAAAYADFLNTAPGSVPEVASAPRWRRRRAAHRLALTLGEPARMVASLRGFTETGNLVDGVAGVAPSAPPKICFVFSGNGSQWAGMGRAAFARNRAFRQCFSETDEIFIRLAGWS